MNIRLSILFLLLLLKTAFCRTQDLNDSTLMTVDGKSISAGEFIRMYNKSHESVQLPDIEEYMQQFIIFRLKVADALRQGLDTTKAFHNELEGYRKQLARDYLTDTRTKEELLHKMYKRSQIEINAWHILVNCPADADPADTLIAWDKACDIRERILRGESFEQVARGTSDDPTVRINGGNLGYFTIFQMITPFEEAAYSLQKGDLSHPVRTPLGYHIIRIADVRPAKGKVLVAHIMKASSPETGVETEKEAEESINRIYRELVEGKPFSELAKQYSDHKASASNGGKLDWFGAGEIINDFAEAALSIPDTGLFTKPLRTPYGWHIIKLLGRKAPESFEEKRSFLESKINQSYLNTLSERSFVDSLKKEYNFRIDKNIYSWFVSNTDTLTIRGYTIYPRGSIPAGNIYTFADQNLTALEFASYTEQRKSMIPTNDPASFVNKSIENLSSDQILKYENSILEKKYPEFMYLMNEFHDGILLFDVSEKKIWNRVQEDTAGLLAYYYDHKHEFLTKKAIEAKLYTLRIPQGEKTLTRSYRKYARKRDRDRLMLERFNGNNDTVLVITEKTWFEGDDPQIDKIKWAKGKNALKINNYPSLLVIEKILEPGPKAFKEVEGEMMNGYQEYLEKEWIGQLREKYTVKIDDLIFEKVKKSLINE